jgi:glycosyltransferase XagB
MGQVERVAAKGQAAAGLLRPDAPHSGFDDTQFDDRHLDERRLVESHFDEMQRGVTAYEAGPKWQGALRRPLPAAGTAAMSLAGQPADRQSANREPPKRHVPDRRPADWQLPDDAALLARHGMAREILASAAEIASAKGLAAGEVLVARGHLDAGEYRRILALETGAACAAIVADPRAGVIGRQQVGDVVRETPLLGRHLGEARVFVPADPARLTRLLAFARKGTRLLRPFVLVPPAAIRIAHLMRSRNAYSHRAIHALDAAMPEFSARRRLSHVQMQVLLGLALTFAWLFVLLPGLTQAFIAALVILFYLATIFLRVFVLTLLDSLPWPQTETGAVPDDAGWPAAEDLPLYSIFVPLYREAGQVCDLVSAIASMDWPASRREVFLVCEEDDTHTIRAVRACALPEGFHLVCCPKSFPRTKPKALNFALPLAKGEFIVVYDAEDRPHPLQLREAYKRFAADGSDLACLQAPLAATNGAAGWLSAMYAVEYDTLFRGTLPALASIGGPLPLGGTSNHFRTEALRACMAWDAWNVTEDADLGVRLARMGYRCATIELPTLEEAPETLPVWMRQRTRWLKGWMQTILVHMRDPLRLQRELGWSGFLVFQLSMTTIVASVLAHPFVLAHAILSLCRITLGHELSARQFAYVGLDLFSITASYMTYGLLAGAVARRSGKRVGICLQLSLPAYWLLISAAGWRAAWQFVREPFKWEKTEHGLAKPGASANIETRFAAKDT